MLDNFMRRYRNARACVAQIRAGEWVPRYNSLSDKYITAHRGPLELWIGNGAWFCDIQPAEHFGVFWRYYVWWAAARRLARTPLPARDRRTVPTL